MSDPYSINYIILIIPHYDALLSLLITYGYLYSYSSSSYGLGSTLVSIVSIDESAIDLVTRSTNIP